MYTSGQRLKSTFFWNIFHQSAGPCGTAQLEFFFKNVDFSLWGKQCGFPKLYFFSDFSPLCCHWKARGVTNKIDIIPTNIWTALRKRISGYRWWSKNNYNTSKKLDNYKKPHFFLKFSISRNRKLKINMYSLTTQVIGQA